MVSKAEALALVRPWEQVVEVPTGRVQVELSFRVKVEVAVQHQTVSAGPLGVVLQVFPDLVSRTGGVHPVSGELGVS